MPTNQQNSYWEEDVDSSAGDDWFMAGHSKLMEPFMKVSHKSMSFVIFVSEKYF